MKILFSPRDRKIGGYALLILLLQVLTYVLCADTRLAERVVRELNANDGGMPKGFALVTAESRNAMTPGLLRALEDEISRSGHPLLRNLEDVLPEKRIYGETSSGERRIVGYRDGCDVSLQTHTRFPGVITASYGFHMGPEGAWGVTRVLVWCFGTWIPVWSWGPYMA